jgi:hypothetical protein
VYAYFYRVFYRFIVSIISGSLCSKSFIHSSFPPVVSPYIFSFFYYLHREMISSWFLYVCLRSFLRSRLCSNKFRSISTKSELEIGIIDVRRNWFVV